MKRFLIPISALFLAACGAAEAPTEVNSDTVLDDKLFQEATTANDLAKCDEIADSSKKEDCKMVVNSFLITADAVAKLDVSLCKGIEDKRYKENCEDEVEAKVNEKNEYLEKLEKNKELEEERLKIESEAQSKNDPNICDQLTNENAKLSCKYNIIANQAIQNNNPSLCETLEEESFVTECKNVLEATE